VVLAFLDFVDSREKAVLVWTLVAFAWAVMKVDGFLVSLGGILHVLYGKLLLPFVLLASYCAGLVIAAQPLGLWHTTAIKEIVYWFFGTGVLLVGRAIESANSPNWARTIFRPALRLTLIVEFLINLYVFPFGIEMVLVPFVVLFVLVEAVAALDQAQAPAQRFSSGVITTIGFGLLAYVLVSVFNDLSGFLTRENAEDFLLVPALTLASFPILFVIVRWVRSDTAGVRRRWQAGIDSAKESQVRLGPGAEAGAVIAGATKRRAA
jgi:hypothetical protein